MVVANAVGRAGSTDGEALRAAIAKTDYQGILGPIVFDDHDQAHNNMMYLRVENGKLEVKELIPAR
jgi:branched-chain amino acid transport system substrate-binding protein